MSSNAPSNAQPNDWSKSAVAAGRSRHIHHPDTATEMLAALLTAVQIRRSCRA
jgi:hypothetical protein